MTVNIVFRARINKGKKLFTNIRELIYPPRDIISQDAAIIELRPSEYDYLTLIATKPKDPKPLDTWSLGYSNT